MTELVQEFSGALGRNPIRQRAAGDLGSHAPRGLTAGAFDRTPDHHGPAESRQPLRPHDRHLPAVSRPSADFRRRIRAPARSRVHGSSRVLSEERISTRSREPNWRTRRPFVASTTIYMLKVATAHALSKCRYLPAATLYSELRPGGLFLKKMPNRWAARRKPLLDFNSNDTA